jgi:hypothetical protein
MLQAPRVRSALLAIAGLMAMGPAAWAAQPYYKVDTVPLWLAPGNKSAGAAINNTGKTAVQMYQLGGGAAGYRCGATACKSIEGLDSDQHHSGLSVSGVDDSGLVVGTSPWATPPARRASGITTASSTTAARSTT